VFLAGAGWLDVGIAQAKLKTAKRKEYEIKAAFIYNIIKFIDWPKKPEDVQEAEKEKSDKSAKVFTVGFVADKEVYEACKAIRGKKIKGKTIQTVLFAQLTEKDLKQGDNSKKVKALKGCDVLFVCARQQSKSTQADYRKILMALKGLNILTTGEMNGFIDPAKPKDPCGIINFVVEGNKIHFEINLDMAQRSGFQIKAQLLKLAKRVIKKAKPTK
ncbi:unnamed protein product, partial [marine sediment metagenome]